MARWTFQLALGLWLAVFAALKLLIAPPIPASVMTIYMALTTIAILVFVAADETRFRHFIAPLKAVFEGRAPLAVQVPVLVGLPLLLAWGTYLRVAPDYDAPFETRMVHPQPPSQFRFHGKTVEFAGLTNPLRHPGKDLDDRIAEGKTIYYQNCFFCHGDALGGGHFDQAFGPIPANFRDVGTISMLQESFVYWRVATGGPGLPKGVTPWNSAMPVWQDFLAGDEIWKAILYIYADSGSTLRTWDEGDGASHDVPAYLAKRGRGSRPRAGGAAAADVKLEPVPKTPVATSIWYYLLLVPPTPMTVYFWPVAFGVTAFGAEAWLRRRLHNVRGGTTKKERRS